MHCLFSIYYFMHMKNILLFNNLYGGLRKVVITFYLLNICQIIRELLMLTLRDKNKLPPN